MAAPTVTVKQGALKGRIDRTPSKKKFYSFEGIPYAKPPIGKLRFHDPQEPESWSDIRDATKPGNKCAQIDPYKMQPLEGSEDCLYLNVYTPNLLSYRKHLPVIFFIHGGRYLVGHGHYYRPDYFMEKDVILVTINYRLNILGFLCLDTKEVPGNAGMKDSVFALKWVKENIGVFNGDCNNITIFGESSGGGTVSALLTSKMADGLYHKVICVSGNSVFDLFMVDEHLAVVKEVAFMLGKEDTHDTIELYNFLQNVDVEDLVRTVCIIQISRPQINSIFLPVVEKNFENVVPFFTEHPVVSFHEGRFFKVPVLVGYCSHEGAFFLPRDHDGNLNFNEDPNFFIPLFLNLKPESSKAKNIGSKIQKYYFNNHCIDENLKVEYVNLMTDTFFLRDTIRFMDFLTKYNSKTWLFRYCFEGSMATRIMKNLRLKGASHSDILPYLFYRSNKVKNIQKKDKRIITFFMDVWTNFAKNGIPSWSGQGLEWTPYSETKQMCLNVDDKFSVIKYPEKSRIDFWKSILRDTSQSKL